MAVANTDDAAAPSVSLTTLGCRVNQAETESLARQFATLGFHLVPFGDTADVVVVNTCTVTNEADRQARQLVRRARRTSPKGMVVVTGCYATVATTEVSELPDVDVVVTNAAKASLVKQITALLRERRRHAPWEGSESRAIPGWFGRTRAQLKVEEGCNNRCTFCIVPAARGSQKSVPPERVADTIRELERSGYHEVVLTGTHLGGYGRDLSPRVGLGDLIRVVLSSTMIQRIRLSSVEPQDFPADCLDLWGDRRLCRHFHLPVQSGSDAVLRRMLRGYRSDHFVRLTDQIRHAVPNATITTDVIVGFPGETDEQFDETVRLLERCGVVKAHVFPYSPRTGTPAATMPLQVPPEVKRARVTALNRFSDQWRRSFLGGMLGTRADVLFEHEIAPGVWEGLTDNYVRVHCHERTSLFNLMLPMRLDAIDGVGDGVLGTPIGWSSRPVHVDHVPFSTAP